MSRLDIDASAPMTSELARALASGFTADFRSTGPLRALWTQSPDGLPRHRSRELPQVFDNCILTRRAVSAVERPRLR